MLRFAILLSVLIFAEPVALGGALVSLVPSAPSNGIGYIAGEHVRVDFYVQLDAASPETIRTRMLQFDLADSSPELQFVPVLNYPEIEFGIPFWNFGGARACSHGDVWECGTNYFIDGDLHSDDILNITYTGLTSSLSFMVMLNHAGPRLIGSLMVIMPANDGIYVLDVLNADEADENFGAELRHGFGTTPDPGSTILRAHRGDIIMVPGPGTDESGRVSFAVIPEPATLALLGLGGVFATFPRRQTA